MGEYQRFKNLLFMNFGSMQIKANLAKGWSSHNAALINVVQASEGDVLEFGAGPASTPLLHWLCKDLGRKLITYEEDPGYYKFARQFQSRLHIIRLVENWDDIDTRKHRGVIFIDHGGKTKNGELPGSRRGTDVIRFKNSADYIILHDTEKEEYYGYQDIWKHFRYAFTWKECRPWTSVVSNFKDLNFLEKQIPLDDSNKEIKQSPP